MKVLWSMLGCCALLLAACAKQEQGDGGTAPTATVPSDASSAIEIPVQLASLSLADQTVEVGCGSCIYEMPGVEGCKTAMMVKGTPVLVTSELDAHEAGLCSGAKQALVSGKIEGDHFVATKLELQ